MKKLLILFFILFAFNASATDIHYIPDDLFAQKPNIFIRVFSNVLKCGWSFNCYKEQTFGTSLTTLNSGDTMSDFPTVYNANNTALNAGKIENASSSLSSVTTLLNLTTLGTLTTGTWNATAISVGKGGTGTTSPSLYRVMLGNGASGLTMATSTGTAGQFLTSNGPGGFPNWQTSAINANDNYTWTGFHTFATSTFDHLTATSLTITGSSTVASTSIAHLNLLGKNADTLVSGATSDASSLHYHAQQCEVGASQWLMTDSNGSQVVPHILGVTPSLIIIDSWNSGVTYSSSHGVSTTTARAISFAVCGVDGTIVKDTTVILNLKKKVSSTCDTPVINATLAAWDSTSFTLAWVKTGSPTDTAFYTWMVCK